jgi:hypothetical protein
MGTEAAPVPEEQRNVRAFSPGPWFRARTASLALGGVSDGPYGKHQRE